ncbi:MAG TPA: DUF302 domain-containing protein [Ktedonobacterales bacterium]|nr:DUF302 domain-containing protein [Ktedonobacterales bacterium]
MTNSPITDNPAQVAPTEADNSDQPAGAYGFGVTITQPVSAAIPAVIAALQTEGFGALTTIDVQATLKAKLDVDSAPYVILGACNPHLAHQALEIEPAVGLLLPCNVVVRQIERDGQTRTRVEIADPQAMLGVVQNPAMQALANEARARLQRALATFVANIGA